MDRWMKHWQTLPAKNRIGAGVCLAVLIAVVITLVFQISDLVDSWRSVDAKAAQSRVWEKTQPLLAKADSDAALALDKHLATIHAFLDEHKAGSRAFAEKLLGLRGKWEILKAEIGGDGDSAAFIQEAFAEHVFPMEELEKTVAAAVRGYLAALEAIDDELLVRLRADIADDELPRLTLPAFRSDQALQSHYHELHQRIASDLRTDLAVTVSRELILWPASNIATALTLDVAAAIAARLGVSSTILSAGAASTWQTLGVGLVVSFVLDAVVNRLIKAAGYDAEEQIAQRVQETLTGLGRVITDGDPEARATLEKLKALEGSDPDPEVRTACAQAIQSIEAGTRLYGLRPVLAAIGNRRAELRQQTLRRLIHESE